MSENTYSEVVKKRIQVIKDAEKKLIVKAELINEDKTDTLKYLVSSLFAEVIFYPKSSLWVTKESDISLIKKGNGAEECIQYLMNPKDFVFKEKELTMQEPRKSKITLMDEGMTMLEEMNIPFSRIDTYLIRINFINEFIDYWPTTDRWKITTINKETGVEEKGSIQNDSWGLKKYLKKNKGNCVKINL